MRLALGTFARLALEARSGGDLRTAAQQAVAQFAERLRKGPAPLPPPRFPAAGYPRPRTVVEIELEPGSEEALAREAERHGVTVGELALHAVMVFLAEREAFEESLGRSPRPGA